MTQPLAQQIRDRLTQEGFHKTGIARIADWPTTATHLETWLNNGHQATMNWMQDPRRQDITQVMPDARSIITVALNYYTDQQRPSGPEYAKISRYGWGRDYHKVLHKRLKATCRWLEAQNPTTKTRYYADTGPIQDKLWAERSGLGWVAKHSNLITTEYGSWVFLGSILTNLDLPPDKPHTAHCGTCTRCIDACPTEAIVAPYKIDANRCIAYHTIENRSETIPKDIKLHNWVAGCDICQDVCPWNQRFAKVTDIEDFQPYPENVGPKLTELAELDQAGYDDRFRASALRRIRLDMIRRNAKASLDLPVKLSLASSNDPPNPLQKGEPDSKSPF
jgi:epoxyqueuosine reductase